MEAGVSSYQLRRRQTVERRGGSCTRRCAGDGGGKQPGEENRGPDDAIRPYAEQTGALDAMLGKIADFYEQEVDTAIANLLTLIEPALIGFLGVTIGGIVIAMYLPMFSLIGKLSQGH